MLRQEKGGFWPPKKVLRERGRCWQLEIGLVYIDEVSKGSWIERIEWVLSNIFCDAYQDIFNSSDSSQWTSVLKIESVMREYLERWVKLMFKLNHQAWKRQLFKLSEEESQLMQPGFSTSWKMKFLDKFHVYYEI